MAGSSGTYTISNGRLDTGSLDIGRNGSGTLAITGAGQVNVGADLSINSISSLAFTLTSVNDPLLDVGGNATLDGELIIDLDASLVLQEGDVFTLIDIGGDQSGTFANMAEGDLVASNGAFDLWLTYSGGDGNDVEVFTLPRVLPGDFNDDDIVDRKDVANIVAAYGSNGVKLSVLAETQANFGSAASPGSPTASQTTVPEPEGMLLFLTAILWIALHKTDRRRFRSIRMNINR